MPTSGGLLHGAEESAGGFENPAYRRLAGMAPGWTALAKSVQVVHNFINSSIRALHQLRRDEATLRLLPVPMVSSEAWYFS